RTSRLRRVWRVRVPDCPVGRRRTIRRKANRAVRRACRDPQSRRRVADKTMGRRRFRRNSGPLVGSLRDAFGCDLRPRRRGSGAIGGQSFARERGDYARRHAQTTLRAGAGRETLHRRRHGADAHRGGGAGADRGHLRPDHVASQRAVRVGRRRRRALRPRLPHRLLSPQLQSHLVYEDSPRKRVAGGLRESKNAGTVRGAVTTCAVPATCLISLKINMREQATDYSLLFLIQRLRVPIGFITAILFVFFSRPTWRSLAVGVPIALCGALFRAW